tara:strand:- start:57 stop:713 length:657 start_codon:yes stop_codon:yes gene_type:complete
MLQIFSVIILGYLLGSIPTSLTLGKIHSRIDIRKHGSGNAGLTNVYRVLGVGPALVVAVVDISKGWLAAAIIPNYFPDLPMTDIHLAGILTGSAAVLGHTFTLFASFHGGKGVAALLGVIIALYPTVIPICLTVFVLTLITWGYVSVSSMTATAALTFGVWILPEFGFEPSGISLKIFTILIFFFIIFTHRSNIRRLLKGTENRFEKVVLFKSKKRKL